MRITRQLLRLASAAMIVAVTASPSMSAPTVVAELGSYPLLGSNATLADLQVSIARNEGRLETAGRLVGMTSAEYRAFRIATQTQRPQFGQVPRRLDAMSWYSYGHVRVIRDVEIPRASFGYEYDQVSATERLRVFLPVACGNLSILRERIRKVAVRKPTYAVSSIPPQAAKPAALPPPVQLAAAVNAQPVPTATPTSPPTIYLGSQPRRGLFPFVATLFGFIVAGGGGGGGSTGGGGNGKGTGGGGCGCTKNPH